MGLSTSLTRHFVPIALFTLSAGVAAQQTNAPDWLSYKCEDRPENPRCILLETDDWKLKNLVISVMDKIDASYWKAVDAKEAAEKLDRMASYVNQSTLNTPEQRKEVNQKRIAAARSAHATFFVAHNEAKKLLDEYGCHNRFVAYTMGYLKFVTDLIYRTPQNAGLKISRFRKTQDEIHPRIIKECPQLAVPKL